MPFFDGAAGPIYYRHWAAEAPEVTVVFLHGYGEHSGLYHRFGDSLSDADIDVWALDFRGHGLSPGARGDFGSLRELAADAERLTALARLTGPERPIVIAGHSLGAAVATLALIDSPERYVAAVISGAPLSPVPWLDPDAEQFDLDPSELSEDPFYLDALVNDPLAFVSSDSGALLGRELPLAWGQFEAGLPVLRPPVLAVHGELDRISPIDGVRRWVEKVPSLQLREIAGARHDVLNEAGHRSTTALIKEFVLAHAAPAVEETQSWPA